jgi:predicted dehydrogenase
MRIGVLGLTHDHVWPNLRALAAGELGRLVAVAEPDPALRAKLASLYDGIELHPEYEALLSRSDLDAVLVFSDNRRSVDLARHALERGLPAMIEKPMAADLAGAEALLATAQASGQPLMVNWPVAWRPSIRQALEQVRAGLVGEPIRISYRGGHAGPREFGCSPQFCEWLYDPQRNGGGVVVDYGGYGALLCGALLGQPRSVLAVAANLRKSDLPAEDNAIVALEYARALGLFELSWTQIGNQPPYGLIVSGDRGTLLVHQPKAAGEGQPAGPGHLELVGSAESRRIEPSALPDDQRDGPTYFLSRLRSGGPIEGLVTPQAGRDAQEIIEASLRSALLGGRVRLPLG